MKLGKNKKGRDDLEIAAKRLKALELRKAGFGYERIAKECGYANSGGAVKAVREGLRFTLRAPAEEVRALEAERLDHMARVLWNRVIGVGEKGKKTKPDLACFDRMLQLMERRAKLLGLDMPTRLRLGTSPPAGTAPGAIGRVQFLEVLLPPGSEAGDGIEAEGRADGDAPDPAAAD